MNFAVFVALDYKSCSTLWEINVTSLVIAHGPTTFQYVEAVSRTSAALDGPILYFGTQAHALVVAIDRTSGQIIDSIQLNSHPLAIITQSPTVWQGKIYVGCSSQEELASAIIPNYACCSFIGNFAAIILDLASQKLSILWDQPMAPTDSGVFGIGVWGSQPSIDARRQQVFIATGNIYALPHSISACQNSTRNLTGLHHDPCIPPKVYTEAIMAFDLTTGVVNWVTQLTPLDAWNVACNSPALNPNSCPPNPGPDADFGMAPTFVPGSPSTPYGKDTIVIGQKNGNLYALNPEDGTLFWALPTSPDGRLGGLIWGIAVDDEAIYYTAVNFALESWRLKGATANITNSAFGAAALRDGTLLWDTQTPMNQTSEVSPTVVNDVVFTGRTGVRGPGLGALSGGGGLDVLDKRTGRVLRDYGFNASFVGNVAVVEGFVMFGTGYNMASGSGAFSVWKSA